MSIRLVATDMDGTFLNRFNTYDKNRFARVFARMEAAGALFVVASGNQYHQLRSFFPGLDDRIAYVAENGAYVVDRGAELYATQFTNEETARILRAASMLPKRPLLCLLCGKNAAYSLRTAPAAFLSFMRRYYHRLDLVDSFAEVGEPLFKFNILWPAMSETETLRNVELLRAQVGDITTPVASGNGCIDLIVPGNHKAHGIGLVAERTGIAPGEMLAFGDNYNDVEMLELAGHAYIMANAPKALLARFKNHAPANNHSGVLQVLEQYFKQEE